MSGCVPWLVAAFLLCASLSHASNPDHAKALSLVPDEWATHWAAQSGNWSDPATWEDRTGDGIGDVPPAGAKSVIPVGITVTQDGDVDADTIRVDGVLQPAATGKYRLQVGTLVTAMGSSRLTLRGFRLVIGSSSRRRGGRSGRWGCDNQVANAGRREVC